MTKAVFLSAGGDPFIASLVLKLWKERWYDEVDKFYICYNNHAGVPVNVASEFIAEAVKDPKVHLIYHPTGIGNGMPITEMAQIAKEDLIMLIEDDGFIFSSGMVKWCFQQIESDLTDIVGSPRGSCGPEIWEASKVKYGLDYSGYGDVGPNWWPNFFFCKRSDLLKTDLNFGSITFTPGQYCKELDYEFKEVNHGDTFVWACIQLRALGLRSLAVPQYHAHPHDIEYAKTKQQSFAFDGQAKWIHGGSLSAGWGGYLSGRLPDVSTDIAKQEIETRVAFWYIAVGEARGFVDFTVNYLQGIEDLIKNAQLNRTRIEDKIQLYRQLMKI